MLYDYLYQVGSMLLSIPCALLVHADASGRKMYLSIIRRRAHQARPEMV
jgi:hypothetical protein